MEEKEKQKESKIGHLTSITGFTAHIQNNLININTNHEQIRNVPSGPLVNPEILSNSLRDFEALK